MTGFSQLRSVILVSIVISMLLSAFPSTIASVPDAETVTVPPIAPRAPTYDNLIITPRSFMPTFQVLADHHNSTGVTTTVVAVEDVYSGKYFPASALGVDNPEKIKIFIKNATDAWGLKYLTLGGDSNLIPSRHAWVAWDFATDLYYADIYLANGSFASWNMNHDGKWGNWTDDRNAMDLHPDLHIGRLPAATLAQAAGMVAKVRNYDNTTAGDKFFKNVTFLVGPGSGDGIGYSDWLADNVYKASDGWHRNNLYNEKATAANFSKPQNSSVGFMAFWGHGGTDSWLGGSDINVADINALTNFDALPIVSIMACDCGNFDGPSDGFAESFLKNPNGGALGVLAGTQTSNANDMNTWAGATNRYFHEANKDHKIHRLGAMYSAGVELFLQNKNWRSESLDYKNLLEYVMFGDPAATIGGISSTHAKISTDGATKTGLPGQNVTFNVSLEDTGAGWADIDLAFEGGIPSGWSASLPYNLTNIVAGENRTIHVDVTIPQDALADKMMTLVLRVNSSEFPEAPLKVSLRTLVLTNLTYTFDCSPRARTVDAQGTARYQLTLNNTGNAEFGFLLEPVSPPSGWTIAPSNDTPFLVPGQSRVSWWNITPGPTVENGTFPLELRASMVGHVGYEQYITVNTTVKPSHGFQLVPKALAAAIVNGSARIDITATNLGNHPDKVTLELVDTTAGVAFDLGAKGLDLAPFANATFNLTAWAGAEVLAGDYNASVRAKLASDNSVRTANLTFRMLPRLDFAASLSKDTEPVVPRGTLSLDMTVQNLGNVDDTYDIQVIGLPSGWTATFDTPVMVPANMQQTVPIEIQVGADRILAGTYDLAFEAVSRTANASRAVPFAAVSELVRSHKVSCAPDEVRADPGQPVSLRLTVYNDGNGRDNYSASIAPPPQWTADYDENITLSAFSNGTINVTMRPALSAGPGTSSFTIIVQRALSPNDPKSITARATVNRIRGLVLAGPSGPLDVTTGSKAVLNISLRNPGNAQDTYSITVTAPQGFVVQNIDPVKVAAFGNKTAYIEVKVPKGAKAGKYDLNITAQSVGDPAVKQSITVGLQVKAKPGNANAMGVLPWIIGVAVAGGIVAVIVLWMRKRAGGAKPEKLDEGKNSKESEEKKPEPISKSEKEIK